MIVTVTLNPALDKTARVDALEVRALNRLRGVRVDAGGKGLNVSAAIRALGGESVAVGFAGGGAGGELLSMAAEAGIRTDFVRIAGTTRTNLKITDSGGGLTELNEPGPEITPAEWREMEAKLCGYGKPGNIVAVSGSLPAGLGGDTYKKLCAALRGLGAVVFLDADGEALRLALGSPPDEMPHCVKPNSFELLRCFGLAEGENAGEARLAGLCRSLVRRGTKLVALSMGDAGAIFAGENGAWRYGALPVSVGSAVGAGDCMVAALALGLELGLPDGERFALAMAASAAACSTEGTCPPERALVDGLLGLARPVKL